MLDRLFGKSFYEIKTKCKNCKCFQLTRIKKGNKPSDVLQNGECIKCGCNELEEVRK